ncbi:MAG: helix-turn-helix domain-containing protein, partial [Anaerovoracaceae bacterium]
MYRMEGDVEQIRQKMISALVEARLAQNMSQAELARRVGTQRSNICRFESGQKNVTLDFYIRIARALGTGEEKTVEMLWEAAGTQTSTGNRESGIYSLRLFDEELLSFMLESRGLEGLGARILRVNEEKRQLFPQNLEVSGEGVIRWLRRRVIPKNRAFVDEILKSLGLGIHDTRGIIDVCLGLSLNDSYWVVPKDFAGCFAEYNLYENRFSEALGLVAYTGAGRTEPVFSTSPELTTHGMLRKAWRFVEADGIYLYKGGTEGAANTGNEPFSEFYACQVAEAMGLDAVQYDLENWKGILAS